MAGESAIHPGARQIVRRCLGLEPGQDLVIFLDETTAETAIALGEAADSLGVHPSLVLIPVSLQRRIPHQSDLSLPIQGLAQQARGILTCVNARPDTLPFRDRVLETQWSARTRVGHMPGATLGVLDAADGDLDRLSADCHSVELALARGQSVELTTYAPDGTGHRLTADIGGWERLPVASDGIITDGAWGTELQALGSAQLEDWAKFRSHSGSLSRSSTFFKRSMPRRRNSGSNVNRSTATSQLNRFTIDSR
jgi:hypothetical protein